MMVKVTGICHSSHSPFFLFRRVMTLCYENRVCFVSLDTIGADGSVGDLAFDIAAARVSDLQSQNSFVLSCLS